MLIRGLTIQCEFNPAPRAKCLPQLAFSNRQRIRRNDLSIYQSLFFQDEIFVAVKIEHYGQSCCFSVIAPTFASMIGVMLVEPKHSQREKHYAWLPALFLERRFARNKAFVLQFLADESDSERAINRVRFRIERYARPCHLFCTGY